MADQIEMLTVRIKKRDATIAAAVKADAVARLGRLSKQGNKRLRTLLIVGATSILKLACRGGKAASLAGVSDGAKTLQGCRRCAGNKIARRTCALSSRAVPMKCRRCPKSIGTEEVPALCRRIKWQGAKCAMIPMGEISILIRSSMRLERDKGIRRSASRISSWQAVIDRVRQAGHMTAPSDGNFRNKCSH
ncbi:hypothetical protein FB009_12148 [Sinorhizobium medicae]|nr:hypothetical protein FB009_12148 [Sinorhizobium medicae]TWA46594.1 hypothetical protein FB008_12353 [Sinorhizobium medicae]